VTDEFLQAAARFYEKPILVIVIDDDDEMYVDQEYEAFFNTDVKKLDRNIVYLHHTGNHFNFLLHKDQDEF